MDSNTAMTPTLIIDPQLQMPHQGTDSESLQYPLAASVSFEPWNSMFETMGSFPLSMQAAQDAGIMDSDFHSDSTYPVSYTSGNEQDLQFPLFPLESSTSVDVDESPGNTSISTGLSETCTTTEKKPPRATKAKKPRRRRSETEKKEQIKQRNRVAASKCRQKKKETVDELKEIKASLEARNYELHIEYQRLRQEIGQVKSDLIHHSDCNDPNIDRWVETEARGYVQKLVRKDEQQRMGSISSADGIVDAMHMPSVHEAGDPYMGLG